MTMRRDKIRQASVITVVVIGAVWCMHCQDVRRASGHSNLVLSATQNHAAVVPSLVTSVASPAMSDSSLGSLAERDPVAFLLECQNRWDNNDVRDYRCKFQSQEFVRGKLTKVHEADVRFRRHPYSVDMEWTTDWGPVRRALYVEGKWQDGKNQPQAMFKPRGALIELVAPRVLQPIHGARAKSAARRSLDQFGFARTLDLIMKYTLLARKAGVLDIRYAGTGAIDERSTYVFERFLPYTGDDGDYPDGLLRIHVDQNWLVPTGCFSFADAEGEQLLGAYVLSDVEFDIGLNDSDYDPDTNGF